MAAESLCGTLGFSGEFLIIAQRLARFAAHGNAHIFQGGACYSSWKKQKV
jgi:hypothetical protein